MRTIFDDAPGTPDGITFVNAFNIDEAWKAKMAPFRAHLDQVAGRSRLATMFAAHYGDSASRRSRQFAASTSVTFGKAIAAQLDVANGPMQRMAALVAKDVTPMFRAVDAFHKTHTNALAKAWTPTHTTGLQKFIATAARQSVGTERLRAALAAAVPKIDASCSATTVTPRLPPSLLEGLRGDDDFDPAILRPTPRRQIKVTINGDIGQLHLGASVNYSYNQNIHGDVTNSLIGQGHDVRQTQHNYPADTDEIIRILGQMNQALAAITDPREHKVLRDELQNLKLAAAMPNPAQVLATASVLKSIAQILGAAASSNTNGEAAAALVAHAAAITRLFDLT